MSPEAHFSYSSIYLKNTTSSIDCLSAIETLNRGSRSRIFFRICARNTWYERIFSLISCFLSSNFLRSISRNKKWSIMKQYVHARWSNKPSGVSPFVISLQKSQVLRRPNFNPPKLGNWLPQHHITNLVPSPDMILTFPVKRVNRICIVVIKGGTVSDSWYLTILYHLEPPWSLRSPGSVSHLHQRNPASEGWKFCWQASGHASRRPIATVQNARRLKVNRPPNGCDGGVYRGNL